MTDYEYLFSTNLHAKLKERIQGGIFVKVNENDSLVIKITRRDENNFDMSFTDVLLVIVYLHIKERMSGINEFNDFVSCPDCGEECGVESYD